MTELVVVKRVDDRVSSGIQLHVRRGSGKQGQQKGVAVKNTVV